MAAEWNKKYLKRNVKNHSCYYFQIITLEIEGHCTMHCGILYYVHTTEPLKIHGGERKMRKYISKLNRLQNSCFPPRNCVRSQNFCVPSRNFVCSQNICIPLRNFAFAYKTFGFTNSSKGFSGEHNTFMRERKSSHCPPCFSLTMFL